MSLAPRHVHIKRKLDFITHSRVKAQLSSKNINTSSPKELVLTERTLVLGETHNSYSKPLQDPLIPLEK